MRRRYVRMARAFFSLSPARLLLLCGRRCCVSQALSLDDNDVCRTFDLRVGAGIGFWGCFGIYWDCWSPGLSATGMYIPILIPCKVDGTHWVLCICYIRVCLGLLDCVTLLADT